MDKTETQAVIKYVQKKGMTPQEIFNNKVEIFAEDSPFYAMV